MYVPSAALQSDRIFQGDVFDDFPCPFLPSTDFSFLRSESGEVFPESDLPGGWREEELLIIRARRYKIVVLSQSCDIHEEGKRNLRLQESQHYDSPNILFSPLIPLDQLDVKVSTKENLRTQKAVGGFYFARHPDGLFEESAVLFSWICPLTKSRVNRFKTFEPKRKLASLALPYREALASKLGYSLSRVALPSETVFIE